MAIAYEPEWALNGDEAAEKAETPERAQEVHAEIRQWIGQNVSPEAGDSVRILYGGLRDVRNAAALIAQPDIDGFLLDPCTSTEPALRQIVEAVDFEKFRSANQSNDARMSYILGIGSAILFAGIYYFEENNEDYGEHALPPPKPKANDGK